MKIRIPHLRTCRIIKTGWAIHLFKSRNSKKEASRNWQGQNGSSEVPRRKDFVEFRNSG